MQDNPLAGWVLAHVGVGKQFRSYRDWSISAGLNQNTVQLIVERGRADPDTLIKMAQAVGESPKRAVHAAGWLSYSDANDSLEDWEERLLTGARRLLPEYRRSLVDVVLPGLLGLAQEIETDRPRPASENATPAQPEPQT